MYGHRMIDGYGYESGWGWVAMVVWALVSVLIVLVIIRAVRHHGGHHSLHSQVVDPIDIVKARYARGEIDKEQFDQIKKDLSK